MCGWLNGHKMGMQMRKISIEPVQAIVDQIGAYVVLKVTGKDGFTLEDDIAFYAHDIEFEGCRLGGMHGSYVLKRENNAMYYAIRVLLDRPVAHKEHPVLHIKAIRLVHSEFEENGMPSRIKGENAGQEDDSFLQEEDKALAGEYEADIRCKKQAKEMVSVSLGDGIAARVYPLGVYVNEDLFSKLGLTSLPEEDRKVHILLKNGEEVGAELCFGMEGKDTVLEPEEPVDVGQVTGIRILGKTYPVK